MTIEIADTCGGILGVIVLFVSCLVFLLLEYFLEC